MVVDKWFEKLILRVRFARAQNQLFKQILRQRFAVDPKEATRDD
jgi:hypothetical protein